MGTKQDKGNGGDDRLKLEPPIRLEDTVATQEVPPKYQVIDDPIDVEKEFMLRNAAG